MQYGLRIAKHAYRTAIILEHFFILLMDLIYYNW